LDEDTKAYETRFNPVRNGEYMSRVLLAEAEELSAVSKNAVREKLEAALAIILSSPPEAP
jgi:hypothetical protein